MSRFIDRTGEIGYNKQGFKMTIIRYRNNADIDIKFEDNIVVKLFSSVFETRLETDLMVEEGNEDYHAHVHLKYQLIDMNGDYNYKFENEKMVELTDEEKAKLFPKVEPVVEPTLEEKYEKLEAKNIELEECLLELAELIGGTV